MSEEKPYLQHSLGELEEVWYRPMGFELRLVSNDAAILHAAAGSLSGFGAATKNKADFTFRFFVHEVDDGEVGKPLFRTQGAVLYQTTGRDSTMVVDREAGTAFGYFSRTTVDNPAFFRWHFLDPALFFLIEWRGFLGVHAAAVVRSGKACLLRGASGQGKTTLAYAAARRDWQALAEDVLWIDPKVGTWWGTPWVFHLRPDARSLFPELESGLPTVQINGEAKIEAALETMRPGSTTVSADAGTVVFLRRNPGGESRLAEIAKSEARAEWLAGCASREREVPGYEEHVDELLRRPSYRLDFGDDIDQALDLVEGLIDPR